jgi:hypothetical protein
VKQLSEDEMQYPLHRRIDDALMIDLVDQRWTPDKDPRI